MRLFLLIGTMVITALQRDRLAADHMDFATIFYIFFSLCMIELCVLLEKRFSNPKGK